MIEYYVKWTIVRVVRALKIVFKLVIWQQDIEDRIDRLHALYAVFMLAWMVFITFIVNGNTLWESLFAFIVALVFFNVAIKVLYTLYLKVKRSVAELWRFAKTSSFKSQVEEFFSALNVAVEKLEEDVEGGPSKFRRKREALEQEPDVAEIFIEESDEEMSGGF